MLVQGAEMKAGYIVWS